MALSPEISSISCQHYKSSKLCGRGAPQELQRSGKEHQWIVALVEVRPSLLSGEAKKFLFEDIYKVWPLQETSPEYEKIIASFKKAKSILIVKSGDTDANFEKFLFYRKEFKQANWSNYPMSTKMDITLSLCFCERGKCLSSVQAFSERNGRLHVLILSIPV
ncbi:hypothetical protein E2562_031815, partial [Oryza meyeriana var. granulata]